MTVMMGRAVPRAAEYLQAGDLSAPAARRPIVVPAKGYLELGDLPLHEVDAGRLVAKGA